MFRYWIVFAVLLSSLSTFASEVSDLYRAKAILVSQTEVDKNTAIRTAMEKVLNKVAGNREFLLNPDIQKELKRHSRYMTQFSFVREGDVNKVVAVFDENKIKQLLNGHNIPIWGSLRPLVLLWVVNDDGTVRTIVSESDDSELLHTLNDKADEHGLPIVLPLMDLTDSQNVLTSDLWGRFIDPVMKGSERYAPESIAIIRISPYVGMDTLASKSIDWYMFNSKTYQVEAGQEFQGESETVLLGKVITDITETMAAKYALASTFNNQLKIDVTGIDSLTEYVELTLFLDKLSAITEYKLIKVDSSTRRFELSYMGTQDALFTTLGLNNKLILQELNSFNQAVYSDELTFDELVQEKIPTFKWGIELRGTE